MPKFDSILVIAKRDYLSRVRTPAFWITTVSPEDALDAKTEWGFRIDGSFPPHLWERGLIFIGFSIVFLVIAQLVFTRLDDKIPDRLM